MEYTAKLWTIENGSLVQKNVAADSYFSISPYLGGDDDGDEIDCLTLSALYKVWQDEKEGDACCKERGWKYHFYHHKITVRENPLTGKPEFVDCVTPGKVYRRGKKIFFKPTEG